MGREGQLLWAATIWILIACTAAPGIAAPGREWQLVWSDEFAGPRNSPVDAGKWVMETGGSGWGNREWEYYTDRLENAHIEDGMLAIVARKETFEHRSYTSARLKTQGKFAQMYGRFEARIKLPHGRGLWPAFWMLGADIDAVGWPNCGEIDIMENIGAEPAIVRGAIHGPGYGGEDMGVGASLTTGAKFADDFHVFALEWEPGAIRWYVDGVLCGTRTPRDLTPGARWVFDHPFFIVLNVAVGGAWPGYPDDTTLFPQKMLVDYVRVYRRG
jgi:beta-glucanase (GH16 family)